VVYLDEDLVYLSSSWQSGQPIVVNVNGFEVGFYNFTIEIFDQSLNEISASMTLRVRDPVTIDTVRPTFSLVDAVFEGDIEIINGTYLDEFNRPVVNATITVSLFLQEEIFRTVFTTDENGYYEIRFDYTGLLPAEYIWVVSFEADGYLAWRNLRYNVELFPHTFEVVLSTTPKLTQGEEYYIYARILYNTTDLNDTDGLGMSSVIHPSGGAQGVEMQFIIVAETESGSVTFFKSDISDENGMVIIFLSASDTEGILRIIQIKAVIIEGRGNVPGEYEYTEASFPEIIPADPGILDQIIVFFFAYLEFLIAIGALILLILLILFIRRRAEQKRMLELNSTIKAAYDEVRALESFKAIIIQTKSKLTIYEELVNDEGMNTNLVGGMVTAFSSFLNELGQGDGGQVGFETMERGDVSLTVHKGVSSNFIVISSEKLPFGILSQLQEAQENLEAKFESNFTNTSRGVKKLTAKEVYPQLAQASLKLDLLGELEFNSGNIRPLLRERTISRAIKQNIELLRLLPTSRFSNSKGHFTMADIIDFYANRSVNRRMSSRIIISAHRFGIISQIDPDVEFQEVIKVPEMRVKREEPKIEIADREPLPEPELVEEPIIFNKLLDVEMEQFLASYDKIMEITLVKEDEGRFARLTRSRLGDDVSKELYTNIIGLMDTVKQLLNQSIVNRMVDAEDQLILFDKITEDVFVYLVLDLSTSISSIEPMLQIFASETSRFFEEEALPPAEPTIEESYDEPAQEPAKDFDEDEF
jgi:hypothetical protein